MIDILVPIKGSKMYRLVDRFHKKCEIHGIRDLTRSDESDKSPKSAEEIPHGTTDNAQTSNAQNLESS
jgi:hypothetical protein